VIAASSARRPTATGRRLYIQDVTLRDGMHALKHSVQPSDVARIVRALDDAGVDASEVAHVDGLAGASLNYSPGSHTDWALARNRRRRDQNAVLTTLLLPGVATVHDLHRAFELGVRSVRIATHCTEADVSAQHVSAARDLGMDVSGCLMMSHMAPPTVLAGQAKLMESYGANCVYVIDSGGRLLMGEVTARVRVYRTCSMREPASVSTPTRTCRCRWRTPWWRSRVAGHTELAASRRHEFQPTNT
jgi:4-hydroxy 2-oxovalerate aldolase